MKKLLLILTFATLVCLALSVMVSAKDVYLEEIPAELKVQEDTFTHFVVFEEEKYYTGSGNTISGFNTDQMNADMAAAGIDASQIGTTYLTRFNVPSHLNGTLVTYVNLNAMKGNTYFRGKCGYIQLCGTVNKIHDMNDCTGQLRCIDFGENSQIKEIPYCFAPNSTRLKSVKNFPRELDIIQADAFNRCYTAFSGELYLNATTIGISAFNNALGHVTGLVLGPKVKKIENQSLCVRFSEIQAQFKPADGKVQITYVEFQCDVSEVTFAAQGNDKGAFFFNGGNARSPYSKLESVILSHPNNASKIVEGSVLNDFTTSQVLFNDFDGADDYVTAAHDYVDRGIVYGSFLEVGQKQIVCTKCGNIKGEAAPAIFDFLGYSVSDFGASPAFSVGYKLNKEALLAYENATGNTVTYGMIMVSKANLGENSPLDTNGDATALERGTVFAVKLDRSCAYFDGIVKGFVNDEQKAAELVVCAYAVVYDALDNVVAIDYLAGKDKNGAIATVTYNQLAE